MAGTKATDKLTLCMRHGGDARPAGKAAGYKKEVGKLTKRATGRGVYLELYGVQLEQIGDGRPGKEGGEGWRGGWEGVNDMYTQTGRIGRKEGKIARKTKPGAAGRTAEGTSARGCLGPSDDSQSSCLLASRFPFLDGYAVYVPPCLPRAPCFSPLYLPPTRPPPSVSPLVSASFVRRARTDAEQALF